MQDYNTIIGSIQMRLNNCPTRSVMDWYKIGSGTLNLILSRYKASEIPIEELRMMPPKDVEELFYPPKNLQRKDVPLPDFQYYYDRIHTSRSKVNISYCWLNTKSRIRTVMKSHSSTNTFKTYLYNEKLSKEQNLIMDILYDLRLSGMAEALEQQLLNPNSRLDSFEDRFSDIVNFEWSQRETKKFNRLLKQATLKYLAADLNSSLYEPERQLNTHVIEKLATCEWIDEPNNLLITGGAGKTHVACALCVAAMHQMRTTKYIRANYLLQESEHAHRENNYYEYSNKMASYDLLVIDDFGLMDLNMDKCRDLFEIIESRDSRKATIIISQVPVAKWYHLFGDNTYADACLSRMTSKAYRLEFPGRDRRVNQSN